MIWNFITVLARCLLRRRYRIRVTGLKEIVAHGKKGILILPNHPALIDPVILVAYLKNVLNPRILADRDRIDAPVIRGFAKKMRAIPMSDPAAYGDAARDEVEKVLSLCADALTLGDNVLIYPSGHIYRSRFESIGGNSSVEKILSGSPGARVVLVRTRGLWGSSLSWAGGMSPLIGKAAARGIRGILASFIFFAPHREVTIEFAEPDDFPFGADRATMNHYLENFYNEDAPLNTYVPYSIWERGGARVVPEPQSTRYTGSTDDIPRTTREQVEAYLREITGVTTIHDSDSLSRDLGIDSLVKVDIQAWLEQEFGFSIPDPEALQTVSDILLAAKGTSAGGSLTKLNPVPARWSTRVKEGIAHVAEGNTITDVFLRQAKRLKGIPLAADQNRGVITYGKAVTGIMVLKRIFEKVEGEYVGLMFPALSIVPVVYLSALFAGKTPVMINWTVGSRSIKHSLQLLGVKKVITSAQFLSKIEAQGVDLAEIRDRFVFLEDEAKKIGTLSKLGALLKSKISWASLRRVRVNETAVILFTSGSESMPKAVPLTHENILTNVRDALASFDLSTNEKIIGFLPPFHSFGLTVTVVLPLAGGLRAVYHPNPTEGRFLARLIDAYKVTMLIGTPTFLEGVTRTAEDHEIKSLRLVVSGAEKCPDRLYDAVEKRWPGMTILEGYGITECSPVVSVNREDNPKRGTIGKILPSIEYVLRDVDSGKRTVPGTPGMLLVRGKSIFGGYRNYEGPSPFEKFEGKEWYRTGDIVREENGVLVFAGRLKRFVKLGGEMISLPAIEEVLLAKFQAPDMDICLAVESTPSETNTEIVLFTTTGVTREEANAAIRAAGLSPIHNIRLVRTIEKIPLLGTGKTDYRTLKSTL
jgi:acyl-CoA synthetase (AMP-forming)/AMP-acid ligase II/1-acyl-sn-glycerol-3-phosphate acyltransferase/acyl carrier protein